MQKYEFLYSDKEKVIPVHLKKTNFGYAPLRGLEGETVNIEFWDMRVVINQTGDNIVADEDGGFVILLMKNIYQAPNPEFNEQEIHDIAILPPGQHYATFKNLNVNDTFSVYIISKKFDDGWVHVDENFNPALIDDFTADNPPYQFRAEEGFDTLRITRDMLVESTNESDINEWYNWQGSYTSIDLIWNLCDTDSSVNQGVSRNTYDVYTRELFNAGVLNYARGEYWSRIVPNPNQGIENELIKFPNTPDVINGNSYQGEYDWKILDRAPINNLELTYPMVPLGLARRKVPEDIYRRQSSFYLPDNSTPSDNWNDYGVIGYVLPPSTPTSVLPIRAVPIYKTYDTNGPENPYYYWRYTANEGDELVFYAINLSYEYDPNNDEDGVIGPGDGIVQNTAQLAILQNIRFLKKLMTMVNENLWNTVTTTISSLTDKMQAVIDRINTFDNTNSINSKIEARVSNEQLEVKHTSIKDGSIIEDWKNFNQFTLSNEVGILTLNISSLSDPGQYIFSIRPPQTRIEIGSIEGDILIVPSEFEGNREIMKTPQTRDNFFYGWNIEFFSSDGTPLGITKKIVGSLHNSAGQKLKVSPYVNEDLDLDGNNLIAKIWPDSFESQLIEVNLVEHNSKTLSYSLYGKRSMDRTSGIMKIYDYAGNVYKTFSMGTLSTEETDGNIIDYRVNINDEFIFDDEDV